ncbi:putative NADH dehydrogenase (Quinone) [Thiomonas arsenitoxydans]|uniref:Probable inorganic carbon transporter subunit DabB n=1 Tax=Thiomonas arsenitoxydans (strain DSM 22701 / CIP 110005 / 3As) TaxID=426114 RepID=D6CQJ5_THIA3|nr:proton-conducting transporter membrane subunit [Thiomonas arsenitoxydans]CAZ86886.1 putative NADH dehydrogenase (quinone) [Thiomonas arsenitoxydans]CQR28000.1 putative NADH dehydrogenase (Quinone) [Thiomonas arsenitoxydans]CQR30488.1 putative NADH dehydrogenase (Quinone) [Thiomonas arsenitoxydans]CQR31875.1 putative NADH dehydrogenase (Quinone) [Thiomonas arsenitoxydans]CQR32104.1 putative NADH dehydrogenase (Quinone) [Thiomonas arsenitoxydans]
MNWIDVAVLALPALPLLSAALIPLSTGGHPRRAARWSIGFTTFTLLVALALLVQHLRGAEGQSLFVGVQSIGLLLDPLSLAMSVLVAGISLIVHVYSLNYMADEPGYVRFFSLLDLMTATILLMVSAGDLITLLVAWFAVGQLLYFLLGHNTQREVTGRYAFWTFITYRLGDLPLVGAALLLVKAYGAWDLPTLFARVAADPHLQLGGVAVVPVAALLVALAAFARSAQFPLHIWLPYTMDGPTPVSALMHAGIVNAGGFLFNRFAPLLIHAPDVLHLAFVVGLVTALLGSALMLTQNDIKKSLGYSTMGQMGFMIMECGLGAFSLAVYHLIAHGLFKATLFLGSGNVIGDTRRDDGVPADDIYTFVVERRPLRAVKVPWLLAATITVLVPAVVLGLSHWLVAADFFHKQGAIVLLFFGWVTGAQVFFSIHKLPSENPWRSLTLIFLSFLIVVVGYTLIAHAFETFLYPDPVLRDATYAAAGINLLAFDLMIIFFTLVLVGAWLVTFYAQSLDLEGRQGTLWNAIYLNLYALFSREFYISDIYTQMSHATVAASKRVNVWLRWV